jgi:hypothetical protein
VAVAGGSGWCLLDRGIEAAAVAAATVAKIARYERETKAAVAGSARI